MTFKHVKISVDQMACFLIISKWIKIFTTRNAVLPTVRHTFDNLVKSFLAHFLFTRHLYKIFLIQWDNPMRFERFIFTTSDNAKTWIRTMRCKVECILSCMKMLHCMRILYCKNEIFFGHEIIYFQFFFIQKVFFSGW